MQDSAASHVSQMVKILDLFLMTVFLYADDEGHGVRIDSSDSSVTARPMRASRTLSLNTGWVALSSKICLAQRVLFTEPVD